MSGRQVFKGKQKWMTIKYSINPADLIPFDYAISDEHTSKQLVLYSLSFQALLMPETLKYVEELLAHHSGA